MMKVIDYIKSFPQGKADAVSTSYWMVNEAARKLLRLSVSLKQERYGTDKQGIIGMQKEKI